MEVAGVSVCRLVYEVLKPQFSRVLKIVTLAQLHSSLETISGLYAIRTDCISHKLLLSLILNVVVCFEALRGHLLTRTKYAQEQGRCRTCIAPYTFDSLLICYPGG